MMLSAFQLAMYEGFPDENYLLGCLGFWLIGGGLSLLRFSGYRLLRIAGWICLVAVAAGLFFPLSFWFFFLLPIFSGWGWAFIILYLALFFYEPGNGGQGQ